MVLGLLKDGSRLVDKLNTPCRLIDPSRTTSIDKIDQAMSFGHPCSDKSTQEVLLDEWGHGDEHLLPTILTLQRSRALGLSN